MSGAVSPPRLAGMHFPLPGDLLRYSQAPFGVGSPAFKRYYVITKTAASFSPCASVSLAHGLLRLFPRFARTGSGNPRPCAWMLVRRCHPFPARFEGSVRSLPASQDTPMCLCPAPRSRPGLHALGLRPTTVATYCGHLGSVPPYTIRKTRTINELSGFNHAALALAPYASCAPYGRATQCSLPSGCQPFSGGCLFSTGYRLTCFIFLSLVSSCSGSWRDVSIRGFA